METSMFELASRRKIRFESRQGQLTVEDLWDLPLTSNSGRANLDDIARGLHKLLKSGDDVSFVIKDRKSDPGIQLAFDVVKHIINVRLEENEAENLRQANAAKKQKILEVIASKEHEDLKSMSLDDLKKLVENL